MTTSISYIYSLVMLGIAVIFEFDYSPRTFFDTSPMLFLFVALGRWLEHVAKQKTTSAMEDLLAMQAHTARLCHVETIGHGAGKTKGAGAAGAAGKDKSSGIGAGQVGKKGPPEKMNKQGMPKEKDSIAAGESIPLRILSEEVIDVELIQRGDIIRVLPGTLYLHILLLNNHSDDIDLIIEHRLTFSLLIFL